MFFLLFMNQNPTFDERQVSLTTLSQLTISGQWRFLMNIDLHNVRVELGGSE